MALDVPFVAAQATLAFEDNPANTDAVGIGSETFTFATTPADDFDLAIGADAEASRDNLLAALNEFSGLVYAEPAVVEGDPAILCTARTPGAIGNLIALTGEALVLVWDAANPSGGDGDFTSWAESILRTNQVNAEVRYELLSAIPTTD